MPSTTEIIPTAKPPLVNVISFTSYIRCIYTLKFGQYRTLFCLANSSVSSMPYMQFLFVRPRLCFGLPSDSASRRTPLPSANSSYCHACSGLSPPCCIACRAHQKPRYGNAVSRKSEKLDIALYRRENAARAGLPPCRACRRRGDEITASLSASPCRREHYQQQRIYLESAEQHRERENEL